MTARIGLEAIAASLCGGDGDDLPRGQAGARKKTGTLWLNLGDSYSSHDPGGYRNGEFLNPGGRQPVKQGQARNRAGTHTAMPRKNLVGIPWRVAFALQDDGWYLRQDIIWHKLNPMPESVRDRCTKAHEYVFLLSKSARYHYDGNAIAENHIEPDRVQTTGPRPHLKLWATGPMARGENGKNSQFVDPDRVWGRLGLRNKRSVWSLVSRPFPGAHFATFPPKLVELCLKAGCPKGGTVLDPFGGAGTTSLVADRMGLNSVMIELNPDYAEMARWRLVQDAGMFADVAAE